MVWGLVCKSATATCWSATKRGGNTLNGSSHFCSENGAIQIQNLAVTVLCVPCSLRSGRCEDLQRRWHAKLRVVPFGTVLGFRTTPSQKFKAVPRMARISGSCTFVSLNSRLESNTEEEKKHAKHPGVAHPILPTETEAESGTSQSKMEPLLTSVTLNPHFMRRSIFEAYS